MITSLKKRMASEVQRSTERKLMNLTRALPSIALLCIAAMTISFVLTQYAHARHKLSDDPEAACYEKVGFDPDLAFVRGKPAFFRHIWGHSSKHPYYRYLGGGFIGVRGEVSGNSMNDLNWRNAGRKSHIFRVLDLRYLGVFGNSTAVEFHARDQIAFFFFPRKPEKKHFTTDTPIPHLNARDLNKLHAATTVEGAIRYIERGRARALVMGEWQNGSQALIQVQARFFPDIPLRTLHRSQRRVQIGGKTLTDTTSCRYGYWPLAATNHDKFNPFIEERLQKWVKKLSGDSWVRVATIPKSHVGDFRKNTEYGEIKVTFTRDPLSKDIYYKEHSDVYALAHFYIHGRLNVNGHKLGGGVGTAYMGTFRRCCSEDTKVLKYQKFKKMTWKNVKRESFRLNCQAIQCTLLVRRKFLRQ